MIIPIFHINQVVLFHENLMKKQPLPLTYTADEVVAMLEQGTPQFIKRLERQLEGIYGFAPVGFLLTLDEIKSTGSSPAVCKQMWEIFRVFLHSKVPFKISTQAMELFETEGKMTVPFVGTVPLSPVQRADYLGRLRQLVDVKDEKATGRFYLMESRLSNIVLCFCKNLCVVYTVDDAGKRERLHMLPGRRLTRQIFAELQEQERTVIRFSGEMWNLYRRRLLEKAADE